MGDIDHDRLFKQLLQTFFTEFLDLFLPQVSQYIEPGTVEFLDKELFTDLTSGDRHEVDLLARCRFRQEQAFFLIHVETQSSPQSDFAARMFRYFARLTEEHGVPVYPIALFSYDTPVRPEADVHEIGFPDLVVNTFRFRVIQLNRLSWREFVSRPNPVAAALMTRMSVAPQDRPRVKLECLRLLVTLKLDRARQTLIRSFMDAYLRLNAGEIEQYNREVQQIDPPERKAVMQIVNEWEEIGEARGEARGELRGLLRAASVYLHRRFGELPTRTQDRLATLPAPLLEELVAAMADLNTPGDLDAWLDARA